ncbi:dipeptidase [Parahaliea mediterranea]|uniref:Membrane dipeptidase n=1 Tax=Parahaliea mediterranea TaxID=651086 RepID=A0A939DC86_9GAMM|nr:membrane dipeptidase [Parahaliea mediterranea]MBN7795530.1 membrane dipeptidase [Parahaliea mediterranea]
MIRGLVLLLLVLVLIGAGAIALVPGQIEKGMNVVEPHQPYAISPRASALHQQLVVGDWHADSTLWKRDLLRRSDRGQVDIPRLQAGNVALQMFTVVTKSPAGQNYEENATEASDRITLLALAQTWPARTWDSLTERALYQAGKLKDFEARSPDDLQLVVNVDDLERLMQRRSGGERVVGGLLGTEGSHALDGDLGNIQVLFDAGFRMMGLHHFFDNRLGGSLHGQSGDGLTDFGERAVDEMLRLGVMIDVAHSAPAVVEDVLARGEAPLIVSHTGFYGHCPGPRNISDELMKRIAAGGGIIGVGYWAGAICSDSPADIVAAIRYGIDLVGVDHVALGSDFDGSVTTRFDTSELAVLTDEMLKAGFSEQEIRKVMGGNMLRFLRDNLPR